MKEETIKFDDAQEHLFQDKVVRVYSPDYPRDVSAMDYKLDNCELKVRISPSMGHLWHDSRHDFIEQVADEVEISSASVIHPPTQSAQSQAVA